MSEPLDNRSTYEQAHVVDFYVGFADVLGPEHEWQRDYAAELSGAVLDLGVGGGRSTLFLEPTARRYVGLDYAAALVEGARERLPGVDLRVGDARDLSAFADGEFDAVVFTFNGLDSIDHEGRLRVLAEAHRVLRAGGILLFSTHNRDWNRFDKLSWGRDYGYTRRRLRVIKATIRRLPHHWRMSRESVHRGEYAIVNDEAHDFSQMHYYIRATDQATQLQTAGFVLEQVRSLDGALATGVDRRSNSLHYAARRA